MTKIGSHRVSILSSTPVGFLPTDVAGLMLWLDANEGITIDTGVSNWADQSGNGNDAVQTTSVNWQPTYNATGLNSKPTVVFDGSNDLMTIPGTTDFDCASGCSIFVVLSILTLRQTTVFRNRPGGPLGAQDGFSVEFTTADYDNVLCEEATNYINVNIAGSTGAPPLTTPYVLNIDYDFPGKDIVIWEDNVDQGNTNQSSASAVSNMSQTADAYIGEFPGGARNLNGKISEILFYNNLLSGADRTSVYDYLANKWSI